MSVSALSLFVYTPFPWAAILCIILYRHDLSQLFHPFKDRCSIRDMKSVFQNLQIPINGSSTLGRRAGERNRTVLWVKRLRTSILERFPNGRFYAFVLATVAGSSLLSTFIVVHVLFGGASSFIDSRLGGLVSAGFQIFSALPTIFAMQRHFGPFPSAPNKFHLRRRRLGSLARYQETLGHSSTCTK
jgi:hypothetical protein